MKIASNTKFICDYMIDRHRWPEFEPTAELIEIFQRQQTTGKISPEESDKIRPMAWGQEMKEMTLKMLREEVYEFRRNGWGWMLPLLHFLSFETPSRAHGVMYKAGVKLLRTLAKEFGYDPIEVSRQHNLILPGEAA